jgi:hypothetical protein
LWYGEVCDEMSYVVLGKEVLNSLSHDPASASMYGKRKSRHTAFI